LYCILYTAEKITSSSQQAGSWEVILWFDPSLWQCCGSVPFDGSTGSGSFFPEEFSRIRIRSCCFEIPWKSLCRIRPL